MLILTPYVCYNRNRQNRRAGNSIQFIITENNASVKILGNMMTWAHRAEVALQSMQELTMGPAGLVDLTFSGISVWAQ